MKTRINVLRLPEGRAGAPPPERAGRVISRFTQAQAAALSGLDPTALRGLERATGTGPTARVGRRRFYCFADLVRLRALRAAAARAVSAEDKVLAQGFFESGCLIDDDPEKYAEAARSYEAAIAHDPGLSVAYTNLGSIRWKQGDGREAERLYLAALAINPRCSDTLFNMYYVAASSGRLAKAGTYLIRAVRADPGLAPTLLELAQTCDRVGKTWRAELYRRTFERLKK